MDRAAADLGYRPGTLDEWVDDYLARLDAARRMILPAEISSAK